MRKTYPLIIEGKNRDRVLDAIKHDVRKYVKRQRRLALPAGVDYWDFDCRFGLSADSAESIHFGNLIKQIDVAAQEGAVAVYVELHAKNGHRKGRVGASADDTQD